MSTDLELCQDLPKLRVSSLRVRTQQASDQPAGSANGFANRKEKFNDDNNKENSEWPRTPTSKEHKIPALMTCPPAPRKPMKKVVPCKRKLMTELKFFEIVKREEVESFFRSSFEVVSPNNSSVNGPSSAKRNCCSCKWNGVVFASKSHGLNLLFSLLFFPLLLILNFL